MALQTIRIAQGEILHAAGETVNTIDVIVQGSIRISSAFTQITLKAGCMPQLAETPGKSIDSIMRRRKIVPSAPMITMMPATSAH